MATSDNQAVGCSADAENTDGNEQQASKKAEKEEESKFKSKYPMSTRPPGGPLLLRKRLQKGQMYFDSGDYYMAKEKSRTEVPPAATSIRTIIERPTGNIIPTAEMLPPRKASPVQSKLASEPPSSKSTSLEEEHPPGSGAGRHLEELQEEEPALTEDL